MKHNALALKINFISLAKFTMPTIIMMIFMSFYTMADGIFVSRFISTDALSAVNIVYPISSLTVAIGIMLAAGGSAVIAKSMGEGNNQKARENFSLITLIGIGAGVVFALIILILIKPIVTALGANADVFAYCVEYGRTLAIFTPFLILQMLFQYFLVTAGKPTLGLIVTIAGGVLNFILDYIFIVPLNMGISGAAIATGIGCSVPAIAGLIYFSLNKKGVLHFVKPKFDPICVVRSCGNGSSEMVTHLSTAITTFLFNSLMMKFLGSDGVAAITIVLYAQFLLTALYLGYSSGISPLISYNYGNQNIANLKKLFRSSMIFLTVSSLVIFIFSMTSSTLIVSIFAKPGSAVFNIAKEGFNLFSLSYLFVGFNIFASALFTALSNGKVSAIISFVRTLLFLIIAFLVLPPIFGVTGVWLAVPFAEVASIIISLVYIVKLRAKYNYA